MDTVDRDGLFGMNGILKAWAVGLIAGAVLCSGCAPGPVEPEPTSGALPPLVLRTGMPLGLQMVKTEAQLKKYPFFNLLTFENPADTVFARVEGGGAALDRSARHTGLSSLKLEAGTRSMVIDLAALHSGREWPGRWKLVGAYFYSQQPQRLSAAFELDRRPMERYRVELAAGEWTPVLLDVNASMEDARSATIATIRFSAEKPLSAPLWCDDVVEIDNATVHVRSDGFELREAGFRYFLERELAFRMMLKTPEASDQGWRLEEASDIRVCFSSAGKEKFQAIYSDGRRFVDGRYEPMGRVGDSDAVAAAHASPATIQLMGESGRVDRNTPGDENNDGYNERWGSYQLVASGPRMEFLIIPNSRLLVRPVIEVRDLPAGQVVGTMEGLLLKRIVRLPGGQVLVEVPGGLERPVTVNLKVVTR